MTQHRTTITDISIPPTLNLEFGYRERGSGPAFRVTCICGYEKEHWGIADARTDLYTDEKKWNYAHKQVSKHAQHHCKTGDGTPGEPVQLWKSNPPKHWWSLTGPKVVRDYAAEEDARQVAEYRRMHPKGDYDQAVYTLMTPDPVEVSDDESV